jgi:hypothetical protein
MSWGVAASCGCSRGAVGKYWTLPAVAKDVLPAVKMERYIGRCAY